MSRRFPSRPVVIAAAVAAGLTFATPAVAATSRPKPLKFTGQGLVVASTPSTLRVLTRQLKVGAAKLPANTVVTVKRPAGKGKKTNASLVGYTVAISGNAAKSGKGLTLAASTEVTQPQPAQVFLGVVSAVTPTGLVLNETSAAGGNNFGDDQNTLTVYTSTGNISVDGKAGTIDEGEFVIVLGERDGDNVVAATVDAYTTEPDVEAGRIADITGSTITLGDEWGGDPSGDDHHRGDNGYDRRPGGDRGDRRGGGNRLGRTAPATMADDPTPGASPDPSASPDPGPVASPDPSPISPDPSASQPGDETSPGDDTQPDDDQPTTVDLTNVPIVLNGGSTVDVSTLTIGERIVVLGETSDDTGDFTPQIAFAFTPHNHRPATHRHHHPN